MKHKFYFWVKWILDLVNKKKQNTCFTLPRALLSFIAPLSPTFQIASITFGENFLIPIDIASRFSKYGHNIHFLYTFEPRPNRRQFFSINHSINSQL
jgi:hypothetical protein